MYMYICICIYVYMYTYASTYICMHQSSRCTACSARLPEGAAPDINPSIATGWALLTQTNRGAPRMSAHESIDYVWATKITTRVGHSINSKALVQHISLRQTQSIDTFAKTDVRFACTCMPPPSLSPVLPHSFALFLSPSRALSFARFAEIVGVGEGVMQTCPKK